MVFEPGYPPIDIPNIDIYTWLFDPANSPLVIPKNPNSIGCFIDGSTDERFSYDDMIEKTAQLGTVLVNDHGLHQGDVVCIFGSNTIMYPVVLFAVLRQGGIISGASPSYTVDEMVYALKMSDAKYIFTVEGSYAVALEAATKAGIPSSRIFLMQGSLPGALLCTDIIRNAPPTKVLPWRIPPNKSSGDYCAFLSFSSGTTGLPKGVMISHRNIIAQLLQMKAVNKDDMTNDRLLAVLPLFHATGLVQLLHVPVMLGMPTVILPRFTMKEMLDAIVKYKLTFLQLVPPILIRLLKEDIVRQYDLSHVTKFCSGGAPLPLDLMAILHERYPRAGLWQGCNLALIYIFQALSDRTDGLTESSGAISCVGEDICYDPVYDCTVGKPVSNTLIKIVDPSGKELGYNEPGEILAKGPQVSMGYYKNEKATLETYGKDGFLHTGDLGEIRPDGALIIRDRIKELIKYKGIAIAPAELESFLLRHPRIKDCAVIGVKDDYAGELPMAFVTLHAGAPTTVESAWDILRFVQKSKSRPKWLSGGIQFLETVPKSNSGKILRKFLYNLYDESQTIGRESAKL